MGKRFQVGSYTYAEGRSVKIEKAFDDRWMLSLYEKEDIDSYIAHNGLSLTLFLTDAQIKAMKEVCSGESCQSESERP